MRRRNRVKHEEPEASWFLTYSDMITLLLTFFVMLFAFSNLDDQKFEAFVSSFSSAFGVLDGGRSLQPEGAVYDGEAPPGEELSAGTPPALEEMYQTVSRILELEGLEETVNLTLDEAGIVVRIPDQVLFDLGEAAIKPEFETTLDQITQALVHWEGEIRVEGHTDSLPIRTPNFPSNWELSAARASSVVRFFIDNGLEPTRLSVAGYGEYRPIDTNDTADGRAKNRRVDVLLLAPVEAPEESSPQSEATE